MTKATHLIKLWFYDNFPKNWTKEMIYGAISERFGYLHDKLEKIEIYPVDADKTT